MRKLKILAILSCLIFYSYLTRAENFPLEIVGVTVHPHMVSGEIPNYSDEEKYLSQFTPGALVRIFIRNNSATDTIDPKVVFEGKTGVELIDSGIVSYCDVPDIRRTQTKISTRIPPGAIDCYLLNLVNKEFYKDGIEVTFSVNNISHARKITIVSPDCYVSRILFASSQGSAFPDGFNLFMKNEKYSKIIVQSIKYWQAGRSYIEHWWTNPKPLNIREWYGENGIVGPGELNGIYLNTGPIPFGEIVIELEIDSGTKRESLFYVVKPWVVTFDFGMGWAEKYLSGSEAFCKTMKSLHLNTVNGNARDFYKNEKLAQKYKVKKFAKLEDVEVQNMHENLNKIHGAEHFGEPQFGKRPAQEIFNYYTTYRHSGYPSTLTLSHEPGYFLYAGVVDFPHFDAYRVVAPHADRWGSYDKYGEKNVRWGSPLETIGDYMRTLYRISMPLPVAAWTQGLSDGWKSRMRPGAGNPNPLEMRIQAYEAVANGALSLYWFNMNGKNIIENRNLLTEVQKINREIKTVGDLLIKTDPYWWKNRFKDLDLNVLAGPDFAILFAIDLRYSVSKENQFVSAGERSETFQFRLPDYLQECDSCVKITHSGLNEVSMKRSTSGVNITDSFTDSGLYVIFNSKHENQGMLLRERFKKIIEEENSEEFDPIINDEDFRLLKEEVLKISEKK